MGAPEGGQGKDILESKQAIHKPSFPFFSCSSYDYINYRSTVFGPDLLAPLLYDSAGLLR